MDEGTYVSHGNHLHSAAHLEDELSRGLTQAADKIAHMEWDDVEQRAEVYTIVQALQQDVVAHRRMIDLVSHRLGGRKDA